MRRLTAGTVMCSADAVSVKLNTRAATTNASSDLKGGIRDNSVMLVSRLIPRPLVQPTRRVIVAKLQVTEPKALPRCLQERIHASSAKQQSAGLVARRSRSATANAIARVAEPL